MYTNQIMSDIEAKRKEILRGKPLKCILSLATPIFLSFLLQQFYAIVDMIIVGQKLGGDALGAVGNTSPYVFMFLMFGQGCSSGFSVVIAQRFGAKDHEGSKKSMATGLILTIIIAILITAISIGFLSPLLKAIKTDELIFKRSFTYASIVLAGTIFTYLYNYVIAFLRAIGDTKTPFYFLLGSTILNIGLDFLFIAAFKLDVAGAAIATIISQGLAAIGALLYAFFKHKNLKLQKSDFKMNKKETLTHLKLGLPMAFQFSVLSIGIIVLQGVINAFGGTEATTAIAASNKGENIFLTPLNALGTSMVTYVGQNFGAKQFKRVKESVYKVMPLQIGLSIVLGVVIILLRTTIIKVFIAKEDITKNILYYSQTYLMCLGISFPFIAGIFFYRNILQGLGKSYIAFIAGVVELTARTLAAIFLPKLFSEPNKFYGIAMATPLAWFFGTLLMLIVTHILISRPKFRDNFTLPENDEFSSNVASEKMK